MNKEDAVFFAGQMEDFLDIPSMFCEKNRENVDRRKGNGSVRVHCTPSQGTCKEHWGVI